jgi:3,4-dihydroxy 2-butanone 4-phosphate synthase/GTP cyclohydrolase II
MRGWSALSSIDDGLAELRRGHMVVISDPDAGSSADLVLPARLVTPEAINLMGTVGRGLVCLALPEQRCDALGLCSLSRGGDAAPDFTVPVNARDSVTGGGSALDRARTIHVVIDPQTRPADLRHGGHVFPVRGQRGGVLERPGRAEAAIDLADLAGLGPAALTCQMLTKDGSVARLADVLRRSGELGLKVVAVTDLVAYRLRHEDHVERVVEASLPTRFGHFDAVGYRCRLDASEHVALVKGKVAGQVDVLTRVHRECLVGDAFSSLACGCGSELDRASRLIQDEDRALLVYVSQPDRLAELSPLGAERESAADSRGAIPTDVSAMARRVHRIGAAILGDQGVASVRVLSDDPGDVVALEHHGVAVTGRVALRTRPRHPSASQGRVT